MKKVYFVRHGESDENIGGTIVGATSPLSPKGREQAERIAERAAKLPAEIVIASTMLRAKQTAEAIIQKLPVSLEFSDLIVERRMPTDGLGKSILDAEIIAQDERLTSMLVDHDYRHSDEENFSDIKTRALQAMRFFEQRSESQILAVTHGAFLKIFIGLVLFGEAYTGKEAVALMKKMKTMNTGITVFEYDPEHKYGPWRLVTYNDHAHLG